MQSVLIIDGAYLNLGARDLERQTNRKLNLTEETMKFIIKYLEEKVGN